MFNIITSNKFIYPNDIKNQISIFKLHLNQIDIYSQAEGDLECGNSSGYHNSKGGLCLDKTMVNLLQTRGLNATGGNGQIGGGQA